MIMTMAQMIEATENKYNEAVRLYNDGEVSHRPFGARTYHDTPVGRVGMDIDIAQGANTWMRPHFRRRWYLNGKVIAAAKLAKMMKEVAA